MYRSQAAFVHGVYDLSDYVDGLRFTAGYRYTWDYESAGQRGTSGVDAVTRNAAGTPNNCSSAIGVDNNCYTSVSSHFSSFGWNVGLDEQLTPTTLIYVRSSNAYRPGGFNLGVPLQYANYEPEHVTDEELGEKSDFNIMGVQTRLNTALYHTNWKSIQVQEPLVFFSPQGAPESGYVYVNAASAELFGAEMEANIIPMPGLEISPHASYTYSYYNQYPAAGRPAKARLCGYGHLSSPAGYRARRYRPVGDLLLERPPIRAGKSEGDRGDRAVLRSAGCACRLDECV
jgi:iron complex outermembrane receptor protein